VRVDEHTIELAGAPVFFRSAEYAGTPALYLHGVPTSSGDWTAFLERTGGFAPDLLGFGRSAKASGLDYTFSGLASFVEQLVGELGLDRLKLVAHDWGVAIGLVLAQRRPELIERLLVCNGVPLFAGYRWHRYARMWRRPGLGELAMGSAPKWFFARALREGTVREDAWTEQRLTEVWEQFDQGTQRAILRLYRSGDEDALAAAGASLQVVDAPALVLWGARDPWIPTSFGELYAERLGAASLELVPDAGHWPWLDQPAVIDRVVEFLAK
jgi:pimeloyl-ACP methyl ester carboxylesterase